MKTSLKNLLALSLLATAACGCALAPEVTVQESKPAENVVSPKVPLYTNAHAGKTGEMAYVVEKMAKASGCEAYDNASLMSRRPGIQFYRVPCTDGRNILYRCEMRQCRVAD